MWLFPLCLVSLLAVINLWVHKCKDFSGVHPSLTLAILPDFFPKTLYHFPPSHTQTTLTVHLLSDFSIFVGLLGIKWCPVAVFISISLFTKESFFLLLPVILVSFLH